MRMIKSRRMGWAGYVAKVEKMKTCRLLVEKLGAKGPLGRSRRTWMVNIKRNDGIIDWTGLIQYRDKWRALLNAVIYSVNFVVSIVD
jgi:hypothetical protein